MSFGTCLFAVLVTDGKAVWEDGFFRGYNSLVVFLIFLQVRALCGIEGCSSCLYPVSFLCSRHWVA